MGVDRVRVLGVGVGVKVGVSGGNFASPAGTVCRLHQGQAPTALALPTARCLSLGAAAPQLLGSGAITQRTCMTHLSIQC